MLGQARAHENRRPQRQDQALGLVDGQKHGLAGAVQLARHKHILSGKPRARIREQHEPVRFLNRAFGLDAHLRFDADGVFDEAAGIDHNVGERSGAAVAVLAIARDTGHVRDDRIACPGQRIEERRFANVGTADDGDDGQHIGLTDPAGGGGSLLGAAAGGAGAGSAG